MKRITPTTLLAVTLSTLFGCQTLMEPATPERPTPAIDGRKIQSTGTTTPEKVRTRLKEVASLASDSAAKNEALQYIPGIASINEDFRHNPWNPAVKLTGHLANAADYGDVVAYSEAFVRSGYRVGPNDSTSYTPTGHFTLIHRDGRLTEVDPKLVRFKTPKGQRGGNPIFPGCPGYASDLPPLLWYQ